MTTKLETFNNLDKAIVEKNLEKLYLHFEVADAKKTFWQNCDDTLVIKQLDPTKWGSPSVEDGVLLGLLPWKCQADEFDRMVEDYEVYYRIWWD